MNTVMELADGFMPGASTLIPSVMDECVSANYSSAFAYFGQTEGDAMCDPSVFVDVNATDATFLETFLPASTPTSTSEEEPQVTAMSGQGSQDMPVDGANNNVDTALTIFSVLTVDECGDNLINGKGQLIGALTPCILAEAPTQTCCSAIENIFKLENADFGGCLCHQEVMDGIFAEAEGFLPGATAIIEEAFHTCTDEFGSTFPFQGQKIGQVSCSGEQLKDPSLVQAGSVGEEEDNPLSFLEEQFSNSSATSHLSIFVSLLVATLTLAYGALIF